MNEEFDIKFYPRIKDLTLEHVQKIHDEDFQNKNKDFNERARKLREWFEAMNKIFDGKAFLFSLLIASVVIGGLYFFTKKIDRLADGYYQKQHKTLISDSRRK